MSIQDQDAPPNGSQKPIQLTPKRVTKRRRTPPAQNKRSKIASEDLPKKTLEDSLRIAVAIKENYGKQATLEQIAMAMNLSPTNVDAKYMLWPAVAYGIVAKDGENYHVTETGRKILAPTYEGEDREGIIKAIATPSVLARFYSDYSSSLLPQGDIFKNVLEQRFAIPNTRSDETINLILANARYGKLLQEQPDGKLKLLSTNAAVGVGGKPEEKLPPLSTNDGVATRAEPPSEVATEFDKACFIITPIGDENSQERKHADAMLNHLIAPVLGLFGIKAIRADKIGRPGHMTQQMVEHIAFCKLCITDLSFGNQNAGYELGIRHTLKLPSIQIVRKGDKIPFDVQQGRTIIIDTSDAYTIMDRFIAAKAELAEHVKALLGNAVKKEESPITMYLPNLSVKI
jgi:hypothetical protein